MRTHYVARAAIGLGEIVACGEAEADVITRALRRYRHPVITALLPGQACSFCGITPVMRGDLSDGYMIE